MLNVSVQKRGTRSKLVTVTVSTSTAGQTAKVFVVKKSSSANPTSVNNIEFLGVATAADYSVLGESETYPAAYRTSRITVCFSTQAKMEAFMEALLSDIRDTASVQGDGWNPTEEAETHDTGDTAGPFFFGGTVE